MRDTQSKLASKQFLKFRFNQAHQKPVNIERQLKRDNVSYLRDLNQKLIDQRVDKERRRLRIADYNTKMFNEKTEQQISSRVHNDPIAEASKHLIMEDMREVGFTKNRYIQSFQKVKQDVKYMV